MSEKTFSEGVDELKKMVGSGDLVGKIHVDQVYAAYQDGIIGSGEHHGPHGKPSFAFDHPRGGEAMFLSGPVRYRRDEVMQRWANHVLTGRLVPETIDILHTFADDVQMNAPREFEILRNSTSLRLEDDGAPVFDMPALIPRLTESEIKSIRRASRSTGPSAYSMRRTMRG